MRKSPHKWTDSDNNRLIAGYRRGQLSKIIALELGLTERQVANRINVLQEKGILVKRPGTESKMWICCSAALMHKLKAGAARDGTSVRRFLERRLMEILQ